VVYLDKPYDRKKGVCYETAITGEEHKLFDYRGLKNYNTEKGYPTDACLSAQDRYEAVVSYFFPELYGLD